MKIKATMAWWGSGEVVIMAWHGGTTSREWAARDELDTIEASWATDSATITEIEIDIPDEVAS